MRHGAPPFEFPVCPSRAWRAFVAALGVAAAGSIALWVGLDDLRRASVAWWAAGAAGALACALLAGSLWPRGTSRLAFDGSAWRWLPPGSAAGAEGIPVRPGVAIDLGGFLLLKLEAPGRRARWLPLERRGDAPIWHAMRCALHDARDQGMPAAAAGPAP